MESKSCLHTEYVSNCADCRLERAEARIHELERTQGMREFSQLNRLRSETGFGHQLNSWSLAEWTNAMCGEAGEAANLAKKIIRHRDGIAGNLGDDTDVDALKQKLVKEIADTIIYADLCIQAAGSQLTEAVRDAFNRKSEQINSSIRWIPDEVDEEDQPIHVLRARKNPRP